MPKKPVHQTAYAPLQPLVIGTFGPDPFSLISKIGYFP